MKSCIEFVTLARKHNRAAINANRDGDTIKRENAVLYRDTCMKSAREARAKHWLQQEDDELEQREDDYGGLPMDDEDEKPYGDPHMFDDWRPTGPEMSNEKIAYLLVAWIVGLPTFVGAWAWCIYTYGFMIGVGLGWFPSLITGVIVGALWPLWLCVLTLAWIYLGSPGAGEIWEALREALL